MTDFGKEIIPASIKSHKVSAFVHNGYWEDIGTIRSFYEANLDLTEITPQFNFYDAEAPIYTHYRNLPASKSTGRSWIALPAAKAVLLLMQPLPDPSSVSEPLSKRAACWKGCLYGGWLLRIG